LWGIQAGCVSAYLAITMLEQAFDSVMLEHCHHIVSAKPPLEHWPKQPVKLHAQRAKRKQSNLVAFHWCRNSLKQHPCHMKMHMYRNHTHAGNVQ